MILLTKEIRSKLPPLYTYENTPPEKTPIAVKFFAPWSSYTLYVTEFDGKDTLFGYVTGLCEDELGYSSLSEIEAIRGPGGLKIERDMYYGKHFLSEVMTQHA